MSKQEQNYHLMDELPANWVRAIWGEDADGKRKVLNEDEPYKWSAEKDPPKLGAKVNVSMNGLGAGVVVGYFAEYGWLGVMVKLKKSPKWREDQLKSGGKGKNPPAHIFGVELEPRKKKEEVA